MTRQPDDGGPAFPVVRQDAHLISAAPDLLAALQEVLRLLDVAFDYDGDPFGIHHNAAVDAEIAARAAIAKALGES